MVNDQMRRAFSNARHNAATTQEATTQSTITPAVAIRNDHRELVKETESYKRSEDCVRGHCRNINKIIEWIRVTYDKIYFNSNFC